jgi:hypothetical protein
MLCFRVLFDQQLNQRVKQGFSSFTDIMDEPEKAKIKGSFCCEIPRCGRSQLFNEDQKPSMVFMSLLLNCPRSPEIRFLTRVRRPVRQIRIVVSMLKNCCRKERNETE